MRKVVALLSCACALAAASSARASSPSSIYTVPKKVEFLPTGSADTATEVVIHGTFAFWTGPGGFDYSAPKCGYMYFKCVGDSKTLATCRMQWKDIAAGIGASTCRGFGQDSTKSTATVRATGTPLSSPDAYDVGVGVTVGSSVGGTCPALQTAAKSCAIAPTDAGAPDGATIDSGAIDAASDASSGGDTGATLDTGLLDAEPVDAAPADASNPHHRPDTDPAPPPPPPSGVDDGGSCSIAVGAAPTTGAMLAAAAISAIARRRRRR